tara:strand:- start:3873 stop:4124 length:252 start_codon:yes stop_codon:yes gene_type:complete
MTTYRWNYEEEITIQEYVKRLRPLVVDPVRNVWEFEGDMLMSDFQKLNEASNRLNNLINQIEESKPDLKVVESNEEEPHSEGA